MGDAQELNTICVMGHCDGPFQPRQFRNHRGETVDNRPVFARCNHTPYCMDCFEEYVKETLDDFPRRRYFQCPLCRCKDAFRADNIQVNYIMCALLSERAQLREILADSPCNPDSGNPNDGGGNNEAQAGDPPSAANEAATAPSIISDNDASAAASTSATPADEALDDPLAKGSLLGIIGMDTGSSPKDATLRAARSVDREGSCEATAVGASNPPQPKSGKQENSSDGNTAKINAATHDAAATTSLAAAATIEPLPCVEGPTDQDKEHEMMVRKQVGLSQCLAKASLWPNHGGGEHAPAIADPPSQPSGDYEDDDKKPAAVDWSSSELPRSRTPPPKFPRLELLGGGSKPSNVAQGAPATPPVVTAAASTPPMAHKRTPTVAAALVTPEKPRKRTETRTIDSDHWGWHWWDHLTRSTYTSKLRSASRKPPPSQLVKKRCLPQRACAKREYKADVDKDHVSPEKKKKKTSRATKKEPPTNTDWKPKYPIGHEVTKLFPEHGLFRGQVEKHVVSEAGAANRRYRVRYEDGDVEDYDEGEPMEALVRETDLAAYNKLKSTKTKAPTTNVPWKPKHPIGLVVTKYFPGHGLFRGQVEKHVVSEAGDGTGRYRVRYEDGDVEDYDEGEPMETLVRETDLSAQKKVGRSTRRRPH